MTLKEEYIKLFEKAAPRMSDNELLEAVLSSRKEDIMKNNENQPKKRVRKAVVIPLVAAFAAVVSAVGAVAVYSHNVNTEYAKLLDRQGYRQEYKDKDGGDVDQNAQAVKNELYEMLNIELDKSFECDGFTLEFPGAVCDGKSMIIFYNAVFDEEPNYSPTDRLFLNAKDYYYGDGVRKDGRSTLGTFEKRDGKTVYSGYTSLAGIENCSESLSINFTELNPSSGNDDLRFDVNLEIPIANDLAKYNKTVDTPSAPYVGLGNWGDWDLRGFEVTPLGIEFNMTSEKETPDPEVLKKFWPVFPTKITFKDGSTLDLGNDFLYFNLDGAERTFWMKADFNYPIIVDDIESIQFASAVIDMDGGVTTVEIPEVVERYKNSGK